VCRFIVYRTRIKICGITRRCDALEAINAGADALGLVFYPGSARALSLADAENIVRDLPPLVTLVGLFVDAEKELVQEACQRLPLGLLQFHGDEPEDFCRGFSLPWMKALRVAEDSDVTAMMAQHPAAAAILLDTWRAGRPGGTGQSFDWRKVPTDSERALVLAGGLNPDNVAGAIEMTRPYAVDVSGGVEAAPGIKSRQKIKEFVAAVRATELESGSK
jgi:phosphoribosylanthranilate isomerase